MAVKMKSIYLYTRYERSWHWLQMIFIGMLLFTGFEIHDGHPTFNKDYTKPMNALAYSEELVKHTYRDGWELPPMP